jgi:hypothetical protein
MERAFDRPTGHAYIDYMGQVKNVLANDTIPPIKIFGLHTIREMAEEGRRRMKDASTLDPSVKASIEKYGVGLTNFYRSFGMNNLQKPDGVEYKMKLPWHLSGSEGESEGEESLGESGSVESMGTTTAISWLGGSDAVSDMGRMTDRGRADLHREFSKVVGGDEKAARTIAAAKARRAARRRGTAQETKREVQKARGYASGTQSEGGRGSKKPLSFPKRTRASEAVAQALVGGGGGGGGGGGASSGGGYSTSSSKKRGRPMKITGRVVTIENPFTGSRQSIQSKQ